MSVKRGEYIATKDLSPRDGGSTIEYTAVLGFITEVLTKIEELEGRKMSDYPDPPAPHEITDALEAYDYEPWEKEDEE